MAKRCPYQEWMLLALPNEKWAAFWKQGLEIEHASSVASGDYSVCAAVCETREQALIYMADNRLE
jgi:hypothetical protein